ncbi:hypothetical protein FRC03_012104 [Tulasnella sp. 419]|nr:hypothetical protein FRC03_012104 [Tulasnella sp. 419]
MSRLYSFALATLLVGYTLGNISYVHGQQTGGTFCANALCVNAVIEGSSVVYQLKTTMGINNLGWMAIGFGTDMVGSPMVITWPNQDGTITISHRRATAQAMPRVVQSPPQVATLTWQNSLLASDSTMIAFTMPLPQGPLNKVNMIYAYSDVRPRPPPNSVMEEHLEAGSFVMDLTKPRDPLPTGTYTSSSSDASTATLSGAPQSTPTSVATEAGQEEPLFDDPPLTSDERRLVIHGILMAVGFLILLPFGALIPRYTRTIPALQNKWFTAHWVVQFLLSSPLIFAGWALGYQHVGDSGRHYFSDSHKRAGLALLVLYLVQITLGTIIHFFKPTPKPPTPPFLEEKPADDGATLSTTSTTHVRLSSSQAIRSSILARPIQNYLHAIIGLTIVGLALWNVRYGIVYEWTTFTGRNWTNDLNRAKKWWLAWVIVSCYVSLWRPNIMTSYSDCSGLLHSWPCLATSTMAPGSCQKSVTG